jgi:hypothetical protein
VRVAAALERKCSQCADAVITVSEHCAAWLLEHWSLRAVTLYDKAPAFFRPATADQVGPGPAQLLPVETCLQLEARQLLEC